MHTLKQLCVLAVLWHTRSVVALPYPAHHKADSDSKSKTPKLSGRDIPEWSSSLQSRGDTSKDSAIRRHALARSFSMQGHPVSSSGNQHSGAKRARNGAPILPPLIPTPKSLTSAYMTPSYPATALGKVSSESDHGHSSAIGSKRTTSGHTPTYANSGLDRDTTHTMRNRKSGIDPSYQNPAQFRAFSRSMPPPPSPPFKPAPFITMGYPVNSDAIKGRPVYGYPMMPQLPQSLYKEPGSDLEPYMARRSVNSDLHESVRLARRGSSLSSLVRHSSSDGRGPAVRGSDGPDRAAPATTTISHNAFSRPSNDILSLTTQHPISRVQELFREAQRPPPPPPARSGSPSIGPPQNGRKSRSPSPARSSHMKKRSYMIPRAPGQLSKPEHKSPPTSPRRNAISSSSHPNSVPQAQLHNSSRMPLHIGQHGSFSLGPDPEGQTALRNAALRAVQTRNGLPGPSHEDADRIPRPGTPVAPLSPSSIALRTGPFAHISSANSSPDQSPQSPP